jgi:hypothetical protein
VSANRRHSVRAALVALGSGDLVLGGIAVPPLGANLLIAITLPGRYIEFEVEGSVVWQRGADFGVELGFLTARQAYGIALARQLLERREAATGASTALRTTAALKQR